MAPPPLITGSCNAAERYRRGRLGLIEPLPSRLWLYFIFIRKTANWTIIVARTITVFWSRETIINNYSFYT
jgi:hypothetical protein